jgi:uncharacterized protein YecE (DUF72 family)
MAAVVRIGCAGWSLPRDSWPQFPDTGPHLQRYAKRFNAVEINSSFYRPHQPATYERWAAAVPAGFRFSVKLPKTITHEKRLHDCAPLLRGFLHRRALLATGSAACWCSCHPAWRWTPAWRPFF